MRASSKYRGQHARTPGLRLVVEADEVGLDVEPAARELDWSILMARAQDGDRVAYRRLLLEIAPYLRSLAARRHSNPSEIEDAVQDVLLTVHSIRHTYDPARPFRPWLITIASRRFIDRLRKQGRKRAREVPLSVEHEEVSGMESSPEEEADRRELATAIGTLPPAQQEAVRLLRLRELSVKEAAKISGMSVASLKVNVHRALKSLRRKLVARDLP